MTPAYCSIQTIVSAGDTCWAVGNVFDRPWRPDPSWRLAPVRSRVLYTKVVDSYSLREQLTALLTTRYQLLQPIQLRRTVVGGTRFVSDDVVGCWGEGQSFEQARADYKANLVEMYEDLANSREPLSHLAQDRLNALRGYLRAA